LSYYRGVPNPLGRSRNRFFPYLDLEVNVVGSGVGGSGDSLPAGGVSFQLSARTAPIPGLPNLTVGVVGNVGPAEQRGAPGSTQGSEGITAQYGFRLAPGWGLGFFVQGNASQSTSGPTTYSGTFTPILQYQPNDKTQLVLNPTVSAGTGGNFTNQNSYGPFVTGGGLAGAQLWSHLIVEGGATYTSASRASGDTTSPTGEVRIITGVGYTTLVPQTEGAPTTVSLVLNPFLGVPTGGAPGTGGIAGGALLTLTVAWRIPLFEPQRPERTDNNR
jgi:hypothetical protein